MVRKVHFWAISDIRYLRRQLINGEGGIRTHGSLHFI
jgi:hypothetical protein